MSVTTIALIAASFSLLLSLIVLLRVRSMRQEDPRLSQGLQLLQSKIAILEDLSDRTDNQATRLSSFLEHKIKVLQQKVQEAQEHLRQIDDSIEKSLEVAEIFQEDIPHEKILERKNSIKLIRAARLSNQGRSAEEIAKEVDLPLEQIELIAKVNREKLVFSDKQLPVWARQSSPLIEMNDNRQGARVDFAKAFEVQKADLTQVKKLGQELRQSVALADKNFVEESEIVQRTRSLLNSPMATKAFEKAKEVGDKILGATERVLQAEPSSTAAQKTKVVPSSYVKDNLNVNKDETKEVETSQIKKVLFPRIDVNDTLG